MSKKLSESQISQVAFDFHDYTYCSIYNLAEGDK